MAEIINLSEDAFDKAIQGTQAPAIVDFWAAWCGPCKAIAPILEDLQKDMGDAVQVYKVDVDSNTALAGKYGVQSIPTLLFFKDGEVKDKVVGLTNKDVLKSKVEALAAANA